MQGMTGHATQLALLVTGRLDQTGVLTAGHAHHAVAPKVIVALGGTAMEGLLGLDGSVGSQRSRFHTLRGVPVMVTYHPSYLLRSGEKSEKRKVWEDLLLVMDQLGMPISAKQRSFFL